MKRERNARPVRFLPLQVERLQSPFGMDADTQVCLDTAGDQ
jgi:hypothetical protein